MNEKKYHNGSREWWRDRAWRLEHALEHLLQGLETTGDRRKLAGRIRLARELLDQYEDA